VGQFWGTGLQERQAVVRGDECSGTGRVAGA